METSLNFCSEKGQMGAEGQKYPPNATTTTTTLSVRGWGRGGVKSFLRLVRLVSLDGISRNITRMTTFIKVQRIRWLDKRALTSKGTTNFLFNIIWKSLLKCILKLLKLRMYNMDILTL